MDSELEKTISQITHEKDVFTKAKLIQYLVREKQQRIIDISRKLKIKPSFTCHLLRLNRLPPIIVDGYYSKMISLSHLFVISRVKDKKKLIALYEKILAENLSVAATEEKVRQILHHVPTKGNYLPQEQLTRFFKQLKSKWSNTEFKLIQTRIKSKLVIEIKGSLEESGIKIQKILEKLTQ